MGHAPLFVICFIGAFVVHFAFVISSLKMFANIVQTIGVWHKSNFFIIETAPKRWWQRFVECSGFSDGQQWGMPHCLYKDIFFLFFIEKIRKIFLNAFALQVSEHSESSLQPCRKVTSSQIIIECCFQCTTVDHSIYIGTILAQNGARRIVSLS